MTNTPSPDQQGLQPWFLAIFEKSCAVDLRDITGDNGHQPEAIMYLWQLQDAITAYLHSERQKAAREARIDELDRFIDWDRWDELGHTGNEAISVKQIMERRQELAQLTKAGVEDD